jgi:drug/metabolite transporter (DMT)-like permease
VSRRDIATLLALGAIWGASFMLIEIGLRDLEPATLMLGRVAVAAVALGIYLPFALRVGPALSELWQRKGTLFVLGLLNSALPFFLIAWGQQYVDSGLAAILNSSAPLFTALLAFAFVGEERVRGVRLVGVLVGFAGVVVLVGAGPSGGARAVVGSLAVVLAALCYAVGALYAGRRLAGVSPLVLSLGAMIAATIALAGPGLAQAPDELGWDAALAVLGLGVGGTAVGYILYFGLILSAGASRAILVTYLVPALALVYGVTLLDEPLTAPALIGLALVLAGVALGTGAVRLTHSPRSATLKSTGRSEV